MKEKIILITGVTTGFGQKALELLAKNGHKVYGTTRNRDKYYSMNKEIPGSTILEVDITDDSSIETAVNTIKKKEGHIDVLVNNAGYGLFGSIEETSIEEALQQFDINFFSVMRMIKAVLPSMRQETSGLIVNVSSLAGIMPVPFQGFYTASKFALEGLSETLRMEVKKFNVKVVLLEPGDFNTGFTDNRTMIKNLSDQSSYASTTKEILVNAEKSERCGSHPEEVAALLNKIIHKKKPAFRYPVGSFDQIISVFIKRLVPQRLFEILIDRYFNMK